jgi:predicted alpha/beta-fold hydrolase
LILVDGDQVIVHEDTLLVDAEPPTQIAILLHGLTGSANSPYIMRLWQKLRERGFHVARVDLRGHGAARGLAKYPGHAGRSDDVHAVVEYLLHKYPEATCQLFGVSLSGNITLKLLGEMSQRDDPLLPRVASAVVVSPPIDLVVSARFMLERQGRIYNRVFVKKLLQVVKDYIESGKREIEIRTPPPKTLWDFDDQYTAPLSGFEGAEDYYFQSSAIRVLESIRTPTLMIAAQDDPLVPGSIFQREMPDCTRLALSDRGGHVGFFARKTTDPDRYWMDWRVIEWFQAVGAAS